ncbi:DUF268 domain-containing protein [Herbaspirillum sp. meg3]|uniref:DUF268 domain-containing protein n=1 Tax=Herbaspirillum sp. meg3 TaxID=2025949 RepID=UPI0018DFDBDC|nr:DUF268 domain-containing protein [Herbaspirillum sp. meg3]
MPFVLRRSKELSLNLRAIARNWVKAMLYPRPIVGLLYLPTFFLHWSRYRKAAAATGQILRYGDMQPSLGDWSTHTPFDAHYFYQGAWLARKLRASAPQHHFDISSSVLTISVLSAFVDVTFIDYRPLKARLSGLTCGSGDILALSNADDSVNSLSCLHVIEHIGLGRYGDPIDPEGSNKAARELARVIAQGGTLYLSLPVGRERICFNAHRVHAAESVVAMFPGLTLVDFSLVDDAGAFHENVVLENARDLEYGCGMFTFQKS